MRAAPAAAGGSAVAPAQGSLGAAAAVAECRSTRHRRAASQAPHFHSGGKRPEGATFVRGSPGVRGPPPRAPPARLHRASAAPLAQRSAVAVPAPRLQRGTGAGGAVVSPRDSARLHTRWARLGLGMRQRPGTHSAGYRGAGDSSRLAGAGRRPGGHGRDYWFACTVLICACRAGEY